MLMHAQHCKDTKGSPPGWVLQHWPLTTACPILQQKTQRKHRCLLHFGVSEVQSTGRRRCSRRRGTSCPTSVHKDQHVFWKPRRWLPKQVTFYLSSQPHLMRAPMLLTVQGLVCSQHVPFCRQLQVSKCQSHFLIQKVHVGSRWSWPVQEAGEDECLLVPRAGGQKLGCVIGFILDELETFFCHDQNGMAFFGGTKYHLHRLTAVMACKIKPREMV